MIKYYSGGLGPNKKDRVNKLKIKNDIYVFDSVFKTNLRNMYIDWGTYNEIYYNSKDYCNNLHYILKLFGMRDKGLEKVEINTALKKIYNMTDKEHLLCMKDQFMLYDPVTKVVRVLFYNLKNFFEKLLIDFYKSVNIFTNSKIDYENYTNNENSSSPLLFYLNEDNAKENNLQPIDLKIKFKSKDKKLKDLLKKLLKSMKKFNYEGYCPFDVKNRLSALLKFPYIELYNLILAINPNFKKINFNKLKNKIEKIPKIQTPKIPTSKRKSPPKNITNVYLSKWYIEEIMEVRKKLLKSGKKLELYYFNVAKNINTINNILEKDF